MQTLEAGARVELRGFGAFSVRKRDPRVGRNPAHGRDRSRPGETCSVFSDRQRITPEN